MDSFEESNSKWMDLSSFGATRFQVADFRKADVSTVEQVNSEIKKNSTSFSVEDYVIS